jgi:GTP pyrophosphokinase
LDFVEEMEEEQRKRFCSDVLQLFAPVAARLGIYSLKHQLEARAFPVLYPSDAERIDQQYCEFYRNKGNFLDSAASQLQVMLGERGVQAQIEAREKELFSIFTKMRRKSLSHVDRVHDLFAVRVIVRTIEECYQTLGVLHNIGRPVQDRFKDYIAFPKPNGYQSLHTTLTQLPGTPPNTFVEVQVRTHAMHREAKFGVAAHWSYKEHGSTDYALEQAQLHRMIAGQHSIEQEGTRETLVDHIFVLTPKGDVFELPEGATTLDFAFQIHTDLGLHFQFARVNGSIVSLDYELENGDVVEIQKRKTPQPSPRWMQLLAMASSRSKLKRYLYSQERPMFIVKGRVLMNKELRKHGLPPLDGDLTLLRNCDGSVLPHQKREDILMKIGQGSENASSLLARLDDLALHHKTRSKPSVPGASCPLPKSKSRSAVQVAGGVPMPTRFAQCCKPEEKMSPSIVGIINRHGEVMVHCSECHMLRNVNPGRQIAVQWES